MGRRRWARAVLWGLALSVGCSEAVPQQEREGPVSSSQASGVVVARVNGESITHAQVARLCDVSGLTPQQALDRLVSESLLAQHAEARGYGQLASVRRELKRARVRALLVTQVERGTEPTAIPQAQVRARLAEMRARTGEAAPADPVPALEEAQVREQLSSEARRARLDALLDEIRRREQVVYDEQTIRTALAAEVALATGT